MLHTWPEQLATLAFATACAFAAWRGGRDERLAAGAIAFQAVLTIWLQPRHLRPGPPWELLSLDAGLLAVLLLLTLRSSRRWLLWGCAFQSLSVAASFVKAIDPTVFWHGHRTLIALAGYGVLATLVYGAATAPRAAEHADAR